MACADLTKKIGIHLPAHMTYAVTFKKTESGMDYKAQQFPEGYCLDAHRRQKLKTSGTLLNPYGGYAARLPHIHSCTLR
jgi:hypothetical protein